jgi:hypothetical protein
VRKNHDANVDNMSCAGVNYDNLDFVKIKTDHEMRANSIDKNTDSNDYINNTPVTTDYETKLLRSIHNAIKLVVTWLSWLLVLAALFTVVTVQQYQLLIALCWIILLSFYFGFVWLIYDIMENNNRNRRSTMISRKFHVITDWMVQEYDHILHDFKNMDDVLLLLRNDADDPCKNSSSQRDTKCNHEIHTIVEPDDLQQPDSTLPQSAAKMKRPRSFLFRKLVSPFVTIMHKRKRKEHQPSRNVKS